MSQGTQSQNDKGREEDHSLVSEAASPTPLLSSPWPLLVFLDSTVDEHLRARVVGTQPQNLSRQKTPIGGSGIPTPQSFTV